MVTYFDHLLVKRVNQLFSFLFYYLFQGSLLPATPKYNSSILEDMYFDDTAEMVRKPFLESKSLVETLILLKVCS